MTGEDAYESEGNRDERQTGTNDWVSDQQQKNDQDREPQGEPHIPEGIRLV